MKNYSPVITEPSAELVQTEHSSGNWFRTAALLLLFLLICGMVISRSFSERITKDVFFSLTLAGYMAVFLSVRPLRELPRVLALALAFAGLQWFALSRPIKVIPFLALLGLSGFVVSAVKRIQGDSNAPPMLQDAVTPPLLLVLLGYVASGPLEWTGRLHPRTLDAFLYRLDQSFGFQLSFKVGQVVLWSWTLTRVGVFIYCLLPVMIMLLYARQLVRDRNLALTAFLAFVLIGPIGVVFYNLVPACGPAYLLGSRFPLRPLAAEELSQLSIAPLAIVGTRNAFPSLHLGWALLIWWYSAGLSRWMRSVCFAFLVGTAIVTLGLGEHYFVDLVAAFPFALVIYSACALNLKLSNRHRMLGIVAGLAMTGGWAALAGGSAGIAKMSPVLPWSLVAMTVAATLWLQRGVQQASCGEAGQ